MSLVQQFLQQNLYKHLDHHLLQKLQQQQVAIEDLLYQVSSRRVKPKGQALNSKIERVQNFIKLQKNVINVLKDQSGVAGIQWVYQTIGQNKFLCSLIKRDEENIKKQISKIFRKIFLEQQSNPNEHFQENLIYSNYSISLKELLKMQTNKQVPQRSHLIKIDSLQKKFEKIVCNFKKKIEKFNYEMLKIMQKLYVFEESIIKQFQNIFEQKNQQSPPTIPQQYQQLKENQLPHHYQDPNPNFNFLSSYQDDFFQRSSSLAKNPLISNQNILQQKPTRMKSQANKF